MMKIENAGSRAEFDRLTANAEWSRCHGGQWLESEDGRKRCSRCSGLHPESFLELKGVTHCIPREMENGRYRLELTIGGVRSEAPIIFDTTHITFLGQNRLNEILQKMRMITFLHWRFDALTLSCYCFLATSKMPFSEHECNAWKQYMKMRGINVHSILFPNQLYCFRRDESSGDTERSTLAGLASA